MASNRYHFEDHWDVPFPIEDVWTVLSKAREFPLWWKGVYLSAIPLDGAVDPKVGARVAAVARGRLPYKLRFTIETTALVKPELIAFRATGDFETDESRWLLTRKGSGTQVMLDWNPRVEKPLVKWLSPVLKPVFRWNHEWTMIRGQKQIVAYMAGRASNRTSK
jgi:uncharacterized protein YndB with AHSA1/START domain